MVQSSAAEQVGKCGSLKMLMHVPTIVKLRHFTRLLFNRPHLFASLRKNVGL